MDIEKVNGQGSGQTGGDVSVQVLPANKAQNRTIQERKKRKKKKAVITNAGKTTIIDRTGAK